jgi:hypothetical protein
MTFQFLCPQGHLLEGEEAHMGMQCQCPQCGTAFIIPTIAQPGHAPSQGASSAASSVDELELAPLAPMDALKELEAEPAPAKKTGSTLDPSELDDSDMGTGVVKEPLLHIPCPNGHELETPLDMIGQRAKCPHCGVEFRLKREKSIEYIRQQEALERRQAKFWFQLAIIAASFVVVVLIAMIVISAVSN